MLSHPVNTGEQLRTESDIRDGEDVRRSLYFTSKGVVDNCMGLTGAEGDREAI